MPASSLTTQCPACRQVLQISPSQLAQARGRAVCGHCHGSFDALARLTLAAPDTKLARQAYPVSNELPLLTAISAGEAAQRPAAPSPMVARTERLSPAIVEPTRPRAETTRLAETSTAPGPVLLRQPAASDDMPSRPFVPNFVRRAHPALRRRTGIAIAVFALLISCGWLLRKPLARLPLTGPGIAWLCSISGCRLPIMHAPHRLQLLARDVRAAPQHPGQLAVNLRLRNTAWFTQAYPVIVVHLQGRGGQALASRSFSPATYLGRPPGPHDGLQPAGELTVSLQMDDPGDGASGFTLNFQ